MYIIVVLLRNIDIPALHRKYGIQHGDEPDAGDEAAGGEGVSTTSIRNLSGLCRPLETLEFADEIQNIHKCMKLMVDCNTMHPRNNTHDSINCFWDHHPCDDGIVVGCPIALLWPEVTKSCTYKSQFRIREKVSKLRLEMGIGVGKKKSTGLSSAPPSTAGETAAATAPPKYGVGGEKVYLTTGAFCGWSCAQAYINDRAPYDLMLMDSNRLLAQMRLDWTGRSDPIQPALHWRTLSMYEGNTPIHTFRKTREVVHTPMGYMKQEPTAFLVEETINLGFNM